MLGGTHFYTGDWEDVFFQTVWTSELLVSVSFMLGLLFDPVDGSGMLPRNVELSPNPLASCDILRDIIFDSYYGHDLFLRNVGLSQNLPYSAGFMLGSTFTLKTETSLYLICLFRPF
jgi:hypothetical protein